MSCIFPQGQSTPKQNGLQVDLSNSEYILARYVFHTGMSISLTKQIRFFFVQVVKGWDEGVSQLSLGEKARIIITPGD